MTAVETVTGRDTDRFARWRRQHGWTVGVWVLMVLLIAWYAVLIPRFGAFQVNSILKNSLPLVMLSIGQAVIVIGGGIDLGIGAIMVLANSTAELGRYVHRVGVDRVDQIGSRGVSRCLRDMLRCRCR